LLRLSKKGPRKIGKASFEKNNKTKIQRTFREKETQ